MNGVLEKIMTQKKLEVEKLKATNPISELIKHPMLERKPVSMQEAIVSGSGLIAEFKRASPSKGIIRQDADAASIVSGYEEAGASAVSVLTDSQFFQAKEEDILTTRKSVNIPILRKDFMIDEYQVYQSKIMGADCILLIAAILDKETMRHLLNIASDLGLDVIIELHKHEELDKLSGNEKIIGVNNRNLDTFEVDINTSLKLADQIGGVIRISESGLGSESNLNELISAGYDGFLIGESFMKEADPGKAALEFVQQLNALKP